MAAGELEAGTMLGGCRIVKLLGQGGMGAVYLAEHEGLNQRRAIKTILAGKQDQGRFRDRFLKEARLAAKVDHPNVIRIYDVGEQEGLMYIVMQFVRY